jgi:hypothetical protein
MNYFFFFALLAAGAVHAAELPANVVTLIPKGFEVLSYAVGQLKLMLIVKTIWQSSIVLLTLYKRHLRALYLSLLAVPPHVTKADKKTSDYVRGMETDSVIYSPGDGQRPVPFAPRNRYAPSMPPSSVVAVQERPCVDAS